jgi:hypothetical protein
MPFSRSAEDNADFDVDLLKILSSAPPPSERERSDCGQPKALRHRRACYGQRNVDNSENVCFLVDGDRIKRARKTVRHEKASRIFRSGRPECRAWGATVSGQLRVFRSRVEDEFRMELLQGEFSCACPTPDLCETTQNDG